MNACSDDHAKREFNNEDENDADDGGGEDDHDVNGGDYGEGGDDIQRLRAFRWAVPVPV